MESTIKILEEIERKGYSVYDNFFTESETEVFLSRIMELQKLNSLKPAAIGNKNLKQSNSEIRNDKIFWLEKENTDFLFLNMIDKLALNLNRRFYLGLNDYEFHYAHYAPGSFYKKHKDAFKSDDARKITVILYLNQNWKKGNGGELKLYLENKEEIIEPLAGRLLVFESYMEHEVLESKTDRYSITGWLKSKSRSF